jgi:hypothetical protein
MRLLLQLTAGDTNFLPFLKPLLSGNFVRFNAAPVNTFTEVAIRAQEAGTKQIISTSQRLLTKLLGTENDRKQPKIDDYAGSIIDRGGYEVLFINPLHQLVTINFGRFMLERYLSKFIAPAKWFPVPQFTWEIGTPSNLDRLYADFSTADYIAQDIETVKDGLLITCSCYTGIWFDRTSNRIRIHSVVIPCRSEYELAWIRKFNLLHAPKIFQNGKYDNAYFLRFRAPVFNWKFDTINLFHSYYSELPKDLAFIASFAIRKWEFWKNESNVPIHSTDYYRYNGKDGFTTALSFLSLVSELPAYAVRNYIMEFPVVFPCVQAEATGIKQHADNFTNLRQQVDSAIISKLQPLRAALGSPNFNTNSSQQCVRLWKILGSGDVVSSDTPARDKVKSRHPLNAYVVGKIEDIRKDRKLISSYFKDGVTLGGRFLYQLNPHGTDTGRLASQESHYWTFLIRRLETYLNARITGPITIWETECSLIRWELRMFFEHEIYWASPKHGLFSK